MSFDKILSELQAGKISAEQAKELTLELLTKTRNNCSVPNGDSKQWYQTGLDCAMIRLGLIEWKPKETVML